MDRTEEARILQNYFTFEGDLATLKLVYHTFSELINPNFGDRGVEKVNDKLLADIHEAVFLLPRKYKLDLHIVIEDFGEYSKETCKEIIKENIRLANYRAVLENRRKLLSGCSVIGVGAVILVASYLLRNHGLWFDLINISGTLFVWEGVNMGFLKRNLENKAIRRLARAIHAVYIEGPEG